ncbi:MAG: type II toxin-antitoxin system HipA family toxin YjjJ [Deltaproteobacteria bacterium]|nr:type II toxin-antitoxin system HipA family toxin YjjJ [Deltaproteobacteria bacterium]
MPSPAVELLRQRGPMVAHELCETLGISQSTLSRSVSNNGDVLVVGAARSTRYAARRAIPGLPESLSIYEVGNRASHRLGMLSPVYPRGFHFQGPPSLTGFYDDLPWFMHDLRPRGFLGRRLPRDFPQLGLPPDVRYWSGDHVLGWLNFEGVEVPGSLVVGGTAAHRACAGGEARSVTEADYPSLAERALADGFPGSCAAGEQPKFLARRDGVPVLVKFSPVVCDQPSARVADLLRAEAMALDDVARQGFEAASARVLESGGRVFLEVERFDRDPAGGRHGIVSLEALDAQFVGRGHSWTDTCHHLLAQRRVARECARRATWLDLFGAYIGNTDRHLGNLSFRFDQGRIGRLAPVYDMLPMHYFPRGSEVFDRPFPLPTLVEASPGDARSALAAARAFWAAVAENVDISASFRTVAAESGRRLSGAAG